jgi:putative ABC transport system ATP-binding protein
VNRPKLILADEPTAALDKEAGRDVVNLLKQLAQEEHSTILIVTHDNRILDVADRIINMVDGRIVSDVAVQRTALIMEFLQKCPLFAEHPTTMLVEFAERMQRETFEADEVIIRQGEIGDKFYVISAGQVNVAGEKGGVPFRGIALGPGDFFGEVALLTGEPRNATVTAREKVEVFTLVKEHFDQALQRSKSLDEQLREVLSRRG